MSKYTVQLRWVLEQELRDKLGDDYNEAQLLDERNWKLAWGKLGLDTYPLSKVKKRDDLNRKFIRRFFFREIGAETVAQWRFILVRRLFEIMPYYNALYDMLDKSDPYDEIDMRYTNDVMSTSDTDTESNTEDTSRDTVSDTPMGMLESDPNAIESGRYASGGSYTKGTGHSDSHTDGSGTVDQDRTEKGRRHSIGRLMSEYEQGIVNIDERIMEDLEECFMGLW